MLSWIFATRYADAQADGLRDRAVDAERSIAELRAAVSRLERQVQELSVQQDALLNLLQARTDISAADLQHAVRAAVDHNAASKTPLASAVTSAARTCHACGRTRSLHAKHCIYCGVLPNEGP